MLLGIDLGGTKIEAAIIEGEGNFVFRERINTEAEKGYEHILDQIRKLCECACSGSGVSFSRIGIGAPGALSKSSRSLKNSNTQCLNGKNLADDLSDILGAEIILENDANCFALAEALYGAGRMYSNIFGVIMGTGCGGGFVINRSVYGGLQSIAGEWGHMSIDPAGPDCYCGRKGCVETYISGGGIESAYAEESGHSLSCLQIWEKYRRGDAGCRRVIQRFFEAFGRSLGNLINILDPDAVILGGGLSNIEELYSIGKEEIGRNVFGNDFETPILRNQLGDSAGVLGAALLSA